MKKILAIVQHRKGRSPGQRFRFEHFIPYLEQNGFKIEFSNLLNENDDKNFYAKGNILKKVIIIIKSFLHRFKDLKKAAYFDVVYIYREAFWLGTVFFEKKLKKRKTKIIYDFDDAIWLNDTSDGNKKFAWLKSNTKTGAICKIADLVITGNKYLADYAKNFNTNVIIIPTTIDTNYHKPIEIKKDNYKICIGWTGTETTLKHFDIAIPVLKKLKDIYGEQIYFKVIVNTDVWTRDLDVKLVKWNLQDEIKELSEFDIGIMPLPDDDWSRGKCGFKGLQYMALEIPTIMSPVGVNKEIIKHGENGFLANSDEEWINIISDLIKNPELRIKIGKAGRKTIIENYSVDAWKNYFIEIFNS